MTCDEFRAWVDRAVAVENRVWLDRAVAVLERLHWQQMAKVVPPDRSDDNRLPGLPPTPGGEK